MLASVRSRRPPEPHLPSTGSLFQLIGLTHAIVGASIYRRELKTIAEDGILAAVPYHGPKATAFWFLMPSPLIWMAGRLVNRAQAAGDAEALRGASRLGVACALAALACLPVSGFWGLLAISLRGMRHARRMAILAQHPPSN